MLIRREDEEFINSLKMFGAIVGAVLSVVFVLGVRNRAVERTTQQREHVQQNAPLLVMAGVEVTSEQRAKPNESVAEFVHNVNETRTELSQIERGFWSTLPQNRLIAICVAAGTAGLLGGYCSVWLLSYIATIATIKLIRSAYRVIWRFKPDFDGGAPSRQEDSGRIERDDRRILPGVIKLMVMAFFGLCVLAVAVVCFT
jgi:hypothetical protein